MTKSDQKFGLSNTQAHILKRVAEMEAQLVSLRNEAQAMDLKFEAYLLGTTAMAFNKRFQELSKRG